MYHKDLIIEDQLLIIENLKENITLLRDMIQDLKLSKELLIDDYKHIKQVINVIKQQNHKKDEKVRELQRVIDKENINIIFHLAAQVEVGIAATNPFLTFETKF